MVRTSPPSARQGDGLDDRGEPDDGTVDGDEPVDGAVGDDPERTDARTLRDLRRTRREVRLGDTEWFDVLYRVYLFALVGTIGVVYASDAVAGVLDDDLATRDLLARGPSIAGVVVAVALAVGLRNGADGGPVSIEAADIRHVLLAPISRRRVLLRPVVQRVRSICFALALAIAVVAQFVAREVEGSRAAWAASGALFGVTLGVLHVGGAVLAHALRLPRWGATAISALVVGWQAVVAWRIWRGEATGLGRIGPANLDGSLLFWGVRQRAVDVVAIVVVAAVAGAALAAAGRLRLEPLERRGQLVSQLRFAATVQDIRTVVLLRRQLRAESVRARPWFARRRPTSDGARRARRPDRVRPRRSTRALGPGFVWRRGVTALRRLPLFRLVRIASLAALGGAAASLAASETPLLLIVLVGAAFLLGLEAVEPLAQEIDRPDLTDGLPVDRGWLYANHLVAPAGLVAIAGLVGAAVAIAIEPSQAGAALALAVPVAWSGAIGSIVTTVRDAPDPVGISATTITGAERGAENPFTPPEFAGVSSALQGAIPVVLSATCALPVLAVSADPTAGTVVRTVVAVALCLALTVTWVVRRDRWAVSLRGFFAEGRAQAAGGSPS